MDIRIGNSIKVYSTEELLEELKRRGAANTVVVDQPSTSYYVSVPTLNVDIRGRTSSFGDEKIVISVTALKARL